MSVQSLSCDTCRQRIHLVSVLKCHSTDNRISMVPRFAQIIVMVRKARLPNVSPDAQLCLMTSKCSSNFWVHWCIFGWAIGMLWTINRRSFNNRLSLFSPLGNSMLGYGMQDFLTCVVSPSYAKSWRSMCLRSQLKQWYVLNRLLSFLQ
jgi:hypothetical protein